MDRKKRQKFFKVVTLVFGVAVLVCAVYLMVRGAGLQDSLDFGAGAYYYADIPEFQRFTEKAEFSAGLPFWVYVLLFLVWGALMYLLWIWIDKKK